MYTHIKTKSKPPAHRPVRIEFLSKEDTADQCLLWAGSHHLAKRDGVAHFSLWHHCRLHKAPWLARWSEYWVQYCSSEPGTQYSSRATTSLPAPFLTRMQGKKEKEGRTTRPPMTMRFQATNAPSYIFRERTLAPLFPILQLISQVSECVSRSRSPCTYTLLNMHAFATQM